TITVHPNLGGGILGELGPGGAALALPTGTGPTAVAVADFDGDLDLDIASADQESDAVTFQLNDGSGGRFNAFTFPAGPDPFGLDAGDLDGDGDPDLALTHLGESFSPLSTVAVLFVGPSGPGEPLIVPVGLRPSGVAIADLDGDGLNDLSVGNFQSGSVSIISNEGSGVFTTIQGLDSSSGSNEGPSAIEVGDLDGDGLPDIAVTEDGFFPAPQGSLIVFLGAGGGLFGPALLQGEGARNDLRLADVDHDGDLDVATATDGGVLSVFENDGQAGLSETLLELGAISGGIDLVDLDDDGNLDAVSCDQETDVLSVARGLGDGSFATNGRMDLSQTPNGMTLTDVDGDGVGDLLLPGFDALELRLGAPDGTFGAPVLVPLGIDTALHSF
ncbi:MAG: VCBS repeat-containing protein, partial [Chloroflexi bacterium]|nr:VCBS repeat-containing protein [Chloroflexota bacterium]